MPVSDQDVNALVFAILEKGRREGADSLGEKQRAVFLALELDAFTTMEGLIGFYSGVGGDLAIKTVAALHNIGAERVAELLRKANAMFPQGSPPADKTATQRTINRLDPDAFQSISDIGDAFLACHSEFHSHLSSYARSNYRELSKGVEVPKQ